MSMKADILTRQNIPPSEIEDMYSLFARYYDNALRSRFESDLESKGWIIRLCDHEGRLAGFSSLELSEHAGPSAPVIILYSGDTIIDRACRRTGALSGAFGHFLLRAVKDHPGMRVYWLLTSKGVRTYRFLPVFFKTFYPAFDRETPVAMQQLLDSVATEKFGTNYAPDTQVVHHHGRRDRLCAAECDPLLLNRPDPHIRFFSASNPGYADGDELACIAEMSEANLNARAWRVIEHTEVTWRE